MTRTATTNRWFSTGTALGPDWKDAATSAACDAVGDFDDTSVVVVFTSKSANMHEVADGIGAVVPNVPIIGCSSAGELTGIDPGEDAMMVAAIGGALHARTSLGEEAKSDVFAAGLTAARALEDLPDSPHSALILLSDGAAGNQEEVLRGAYSYAGPDVPIVGGTTGSPTEPGTLIYRDRVVDDCVIGVALSSDQPIGIGVQHGWSPFLGPFLVTGASDTTVFELDNSPALETYLGALGRTDLARDPDAIRELAMTHPLGLYRDPIDSDRAEIRFLNDADVDSGSLGCIAEVPEGGLVWIMTGDRDTVIDGAAQAYRDAVGGLRTEPVGALAFDCVARKLVLDSDLPLPASGGLPATFGDLPVAGFYTHGEFARLSGSRGFHNQTMVILAL